VKVGTDFTREFPDGDPTSAEALATLIRAGDAVKLEIERAMSASFGVSETVLNSLAVIDGAESPLTPSQISERTLSWSGTMTGTLDTLEFRGWVRRTPNPDDRRSVLIEITDEGQAVADQLLPGIRKLEQTLLTELTANERATLRKLLGKVLRGTAAVATTDPITLEGRRNRPTRGRK
jgi:DNA-binding MarR family transcriptional regulator